VAKAADQLSRRLHQLGPRNEDCSPALFFSCGSCDEPDSQQNAAMSTYRRVHRLHKEIAAYVAGLIDGEGTITLCREHRGARRCIVVSISNTDRALLQFVLDNVGAGCITAKRTYKGNHTPSFSYKIANRQALDLLSQVVRYLRTYRAMRGRMALERYVAVTPRNGKYSAHGLRMKEAFELEFMAIGSGPRNPHVHRPEKGPLVESGPFSVSFPAIEPAPSSCPDRSA